MIVALSCPNLWDSMNYGLPDSTVHGISQARILDWVAVPFSRGSSQPRDWTEPESATLQADSLPAEPQGKPKSIEVGSLSLLQQVFLTQESNLCLLQCTQILYHCTTREAQFRWWKVFKSPGPANILLIKQYADELTRIHADFLE